MGTHPRPVQVRLVGELRVDAGDTVHRGPGLGSRKARTLLALLASEPGQTRAASAIAHVLWPTGEPETAAATVASLVSRLRRTVATDLIDGGRSGYRLGAAVDTDLDRARLLVAEAERRVAAGHPGLAAAAGTAALDLLTGSPLADADDADWVARARERHAALLRRARSATARARYEVADHSGSAAAARAALDDDPLDEDAARLLMTAFAAAGEPAAALLVFDALRRRLAGELGADPAPATAAVHEAILRDGVAKIEPHTPADLPGRLVGRDIEFGRLREAFTSAANGTGSLVLVTGEAGAGKTRLASELVTLAIATGGTVLSARCYEAERALFLQPMVEAIGSAVTQRSPREVLDAAWSHTDTLARLVPEIAALVDRTPPARIRADVERRRAVEGVSALLAGLARSAPVLVFLDDLHNAGTSTIELLHFLRTALPTSRVLVVATVRTEEGGDAIAALAPVATTVEVGPLSRAAIGLLAAAAGQAHRADEIANRTGGHALFVAEVLRTTTADESVPATLQAAVLTRVARAGTDVETLLRAGAVLGAAFEPRDAAALADLPLAAGLAGCERALHARLLRTAGRAYEFANDLVREVLYATTPAPARLAHHAQAADLFAAAPERAALHSAAVEDWPRAARAWLVAAEEALHAFASADAAVLAGRALDAAQRAGSDELSGRALVARGRAHYGQGQFHAAWTDFQDAERAARAAGDRRLEMVALREIAGDTPVALGHAPATVERALRRCRTLSEVLGDRTTETDVLDRLTVLAATRLDFVAAGEWADRAVRSARASGDESATIFALDAMKTRYAYLGDVGPLAAVVDELEPMLRRHGDLFLLQWTVFESMFVPLARQDYAVALALVESALAINRRSGYLAMEPFYLAHLAWIKRLAGELDAAADIGRHAVQAGLAHGHSWWLSTAAACHGATLVALGRTDEAAGLLESVRPGLDVDGGQAYLARCLGPLAEAGGSRTVLERADALLRSVTAPAGCAWLAGADAYLAVGRAWRRCGELERSAGVLEPFVAAARRVGWADLVRLGELALSG